MQICKLFFMAAICITFIPATITLGADVAKIGVLNIQKVLKSSSAGKEAQAEITKEGNKMKEDFDKKGKDIEELKKDLDRESMVMDKDSREEKERDIRIKLMDLKALQKKYTEELKAFEARRVRRIQKEIVELVKEIGKEEGYLMIVENIGVMYYPDSVDITDKFIKRYNKQYAEKAKKK